MRRVSMKPIIMTAVCFFCIAVHFWGDGAWGLESKASEKISLTAEDEPLGEVLKKIAEKSGYRISIQSEYARLPVSISFEDLTLHEALRRVLGNLNRFVLINEADRKITFGFVGDATADDTAAYKSKDYDPMDLEVVPPDEPGGPSITLREVEAMRAKRPQYNMEDVELVPPDTPGQRSITMKDIKERVYDPDELEIIPPDAPGEKGLTMKEIEALKTQQK